MMKRLNIFYWILTGMLIPTLGIGSFMELIGNPKSVEIITSLGYPAYLSTFLGITRIIALIVIFIPKFPRLKEWAYAGIVFDIVGAIYSIVASNKQIAETIFPTVLLFIVFGSYYFHHRRLKAITEHT